MSNRKRMTPKRMAEYLREAMKAGCEPLEACLTPDGNLLMKFGSDDRAKTEADLWFEKNG